MTANTTLRNATVNGWSIRHDVNVNGLNILFATAADGRTFTLQHAKAAQVFNKFRRMASGEINLDAMYRRAVSKPANSRNLAARIVS